MLTEQSLIGELTVTEDGRIAVREDRVIYADGVEIARTYSRRVLEPGDDKRTEHPRVQAVADAVWTDDLVTAYAEAKATAVAVTEINAP